MMLFNFQSPLLPCLFFRRCLNMISFQPSFVNTFFQKVATFFKGFKNGSDGRFAAGGDCYFDRSYK